MIYQLVPKKYRKQVLKAEMIGIAVGFAVFCALGYAIDQRNKREAKKKQA